VDQRVVFEYIKTSNKDVEDFRLDNLLKIDEEIP